MRAFECESKQDIARVLIKSEKKYNPEGKGHKISLLILGGHGSEDSIHFGGWYKRNILYLEDLAGRGVGRTNRFFEKNPTFILASCSTGADRGIGQELSKTFGAKVIAPKVPTNVEKFYAGKRPGGKWRFNAQFIVKGSETVYMQGEKKEKSLKK